VAGWPAQVKGDLSEKQRTLIRTVSSRYVGYKEAYFKDGWPMAVAPAAAFPQPGFEGGHVAP